MTDRGVVVSGGGTGMGFAIARAFAAAGDRVEVVGLASAEASFVTDQVLQVNGGALLGR